MRNLVAVHLQQKSHPHHLAHLRRNVPYCARNIAPHLAALGHFFRRRPLVHNSLGQRLHPLLFPLAAHAVQRFRPTLLPVAPVPVHPLVPRHRRYPVLQLPALRVKARQVRPYLYECLLNQIVHIRRRVAVRNADAAHQSAILLHQFRPRAVIPVQALLHQFPRIVSHSAAPSIYSFRAHIEINGEGGTHETRDPMCCSTADRRKYLPNRASQTNRAMAISVSSTTPLSPFECRHRPSRFVTKCKDTFRACYKSLRRSHAQRSTNITGACPARNQRGICSPHRRRH